MSPRYMSNILKKKQSNNKRIIATSPQGINIMEISNILRKNGFKKAPQNFIPTKMINSLAPFNKEMKSMAAMVNRGSYGANIAETISIFNWKPISLEKTLIDMSDSLKQISIKWSNNKVMAKIIYMELNNLTTINFYSIILSIKD